MPALGQAESAEDRENVTSARVSQFGAVQFRAWSCRVGRLLGSGLRSAPQGNEVLLSKSEGELDQFGKKQELDT